jgi:hypothetical protein
MLTKEEKQEYQKQYYQKNKARLDEERKAANKKWRDANRNLLNEKQLKSYYEDEERRRKHYICSRQYYLKNKERIDDYQRKRNGSLKREYIQYLRELNKQRLIEEEKKLTALLCPLPTTCEINFWDDVY